MDGIVIVAILAVAFLFFVVKGDKGSKAASKPATKSTPQEKAPTVTELKKLTKNQLVELAEKKGLKVKTSGAKAAVISEIREQLK